MSRGLSKTASRRSDVWRWVYIPLLGGIAAVAAGVICAAAAGVGGVRVWADVFIIYLTIASMAVLLVFGLFLGMAVYAVARLSGWLPPAMRSAGAWVERAGRRVRRGADLTVQPVLWSGGLQSAARCVLKRIRSFRCASRGRPG